MPDLCTEPEYISRFAVTLYALGFIEDFGDDYTRRHPGQQIDLRTFSITDADYADFKAFMKDKQVPYESDTRRALKVLTKAAADDRFEELRAQFERVEQELRDDTQTNLDTYREQIVDAINSDIVLRHGYQAGVIEHSLGGDGDVAEAVRVLENPGSTAASLRSRTPGRDSPGRKNRPEGPLPAQTVCKMKFKLRRNLFSFRNRVVVIVVGVSLGAVSLLYTNNMARKLREKEQHDVVLWAHAMEERINRDVLGGSTPFQDPLVSDIMSTGNNIPFIITDQDLKVLHSHLIPDEIINHPGRLRKQIDRFTEENTPFR